MYLTLNQLNRVDIGNFCKRQEGKSNGNRCRFAGIQGSPAGDMVVVISGIFGNWINGCAPFYHLTAGE